MTSTIAIATMTVTVTETLTVADTQGGGRDVATTNTFDVPSVARTASRLATIVSGNETGLVSFAPNLVTAVTSAFAEGYVAGHYDEASVIYMRITNKDNLNYVALKFRGTDGAEYAIRLDAGRSYLYGCDPSGGVVGTMDAATAAIATPPVLQNLEDITAEANTGSVDVEVFIAIE